MGKFLYYAGITMGVGALTVFGYIFGVPRVKDPLILTFKEDSKIMNKLLKNTKLGSMVFTTCIAGTVSQIQMFLMCMIEIFYLTFYKPVKFHREVFKFKDGGQSALDWGYEMP